MRSEDGCDTKNSHSPWLHYLFVSYPSPRQPRAPPPLHPVHLANAHALFSNQYALFVYPPSHPKPREIEDVKAENEKIAIACPILSCPALII